jgi:hypothetical protein
MYIYYIHTHTYIYISPILSQVQGVPTELFLTYLLTRTYHQKYLNRDLEKHPYLVRLIKDETSKDHFTNIVISNIKDEHKKSLSPKTSDNIRDKYAEKLKPREFMRMCRTHAFIMYFCVYS